MLMGITVSELHILDKFEDVEYERQDVEVALVVSSILPFSELHSVHCSVARRLLQGSRGNAFHLHCFLLAAKIS